jgi:hypothetical protein
MKFPLFVMDRKSKQKAFVVMDHRSFENLGGSMNLENVSTPKVSLDSFPFRMKGLLWIDLT